MRGSESSILIKTRKSSFFASAASHQKGAYAVEFAVAFIAFFLVLYGMITYGLIFAAQQSMNFAAESGARAGLQWQAPGAQSLEERAKRALGVAADHVGWVDQMAGNGKLKIAVCGGEPSAVLAQRNVAASENLCQVADGNKLKVVIHYPYEEWPLIPYLGPSPIMSVALPKTLESHSTVDLGIALDSSS